LQQQQLGAQQMIELFICVGRCVGPQSADSSAVGRSYLPVGLSYRTNYAAKQDLAAVGAPFFVLLSVFAIYKTRIFRMPW